MSKKKPLPPLLKAECDALNAIYWAKKNERRLSLAKIGDAAKPTMSPTAVKHYLDGKNQLNAKVAMLFADTLGVDVREFSPRIAEELAGFARYAAPGTHDDDGALHHPDADELSAMYALASMNEVQARLIAGELMADEIKGLVKALKPFRLGRSPVTSVAPVTSPATKPVSQIAPLRLIEANAELTGAPIIWDNDTPLDDDEVALPLFDIGIAAGTGSAEVVEIPSMMLRFDKSTLRAASVQADQAACATVRGDSMEPLILDRSVIGIDKSATKIVDGEIYAFAQDGELRVKYLFNLPSGGLRIHSENEAEYPDETLSAKKAKELRILGWVFWWSTVRRRRGPSLAK